MTKDKQIIIDGEKLTKAGFINKFSFKFTNANLFERERICSKFFDIIQRKEQECEELKAKLELFKTSNQTTIDQLKKELEVVKGLAKIKYQCLEAIKELANNANLPNIGLYIDSFLNEMFNKDENCHFDKIKKLTKEM